MATATMSSSSYTGFTSAFVERIATSRRRLDQYVETNKQKADDIVAELKTCEANEQSKIDSLLRELKSLQYERGVVAEGANNKVAGGGVDGGVTGVAEQRKKLENQQSKLQQEVKILQSKNRAEQSRLEEVLAREKEVREKAQEVRAKKIEIETQRGMTVEDLTKGLLNYKYTGLAFQRGDNGALK
jgi:predicted RNase H-like nuclease (RuvC/YqgF family)